MATAKKRHDSSINIKLQQRQNVDETDSTDDKKDGEKHQEDETDNKSEENGELESMGEWSSPSVTSEPTSLENLNNNANNNNNNEGKTSETEKASKDDYKPIIHSEDGLNNSEQEREFISLLYRQIQRTSTCYDNYPGAARKSFLGNGYGEEERTHGYNHPSMYDYHQPGGLPAHPMLVPNNHPHSAYPSDSGSGSTMDYNSNNVPTHFSADVDSVTCFTGSLQGININSGPRLRGLSPINSAFNFASCSGTYHTPGNDHMLAGCPRTNDLVRYLK